jgi:hypothetical protein
MSVLAAIFTSNFFIFFYVYQSLCLVWLDP